MRIELGRGGGWCQVLTTRSLLQEFLAFDVVTQKDRQQPVSCVNQFAFVVQKKYIYIYIV